jgi:deoxycytidine triphosphate deaminase
MIVGNAILDRGFVPGGTAANLKNSTFDLTVGEIIPIGKDAIRARVRARSRGEQPSQPYFLEPQKMVWVLSREAFAMPNNVTGIATLRTTFTKQGILALNVGIIDPLFRGPISTALINFSDRPRPIYLGEKFFRVAFFEHADVTEHHAVDENLERNAYIRELERVSFADFAPSFLNIPTFDDEFYRKKFWRFVFLGITKNLKLSIPLAVIIGLTYWYLLFDLGLLGFLGQKLTFLGEWLNKFKGVTP